MHRLEVTLQTITPLFMGGSDPRGEPELRAVSLRGVLRFWLRALLGGVLGDDPRKVFEHESKVFGSIDYGASPIIIQTRRTQAQTIPFSKIAGWIEKAKKYEKPGIAYLFFSARGTKTASDRAAIEANTTFRLTLSVRAGTGLAGEEALQKAYAALWLLTHLGGIGSRARRGGGNLQVTNVQGQPPSGVPNLQVQAQTPQQLRDELANGLKQLRTLVSTGNPVPTTISATPNFDILHPNACRIVVVNKTWDIWEQALDEVGRTFRNFRSRRQPDYQNVKNVVSGSTSELPTVDRAAFGLPIVFYYRSLGGRQGTLEGDAHDRRASPLFIRVVRLANRRHTVVMSVFKAALLEGGEELVLKQDKRLLAKVPPPTLNLIDTFLSRIGIDLLEVWDR